MIGGGVEVCGPRSRAGRNDLEACGLGVRSLGFGVRASNFCFLNSAL
jgi:hypothetical protein